MTDLLLAAAAFAEDGPAELSSGGMLAEWAWLIPVVPMVARVG